MSNSTAADLSQLKDENEILKGELATAKVSLEDALALSKATKKAAEQLPAVKEENEALSVENKTLKSQVESLTAELASTSNQLSEAQVILDKALSAAPGAEGRITAIPEGTFKYDGKKYKLALAKVIIPGVGPRTAAEVLTDKDAQRVLVEMGSGAIKHVL